MMRRLLLLICLLPGLANAADVGGGAGLLYGNDFQIVNGGGTVAANNFTIDTGPTSLDAIAILYQMPEAATLTHLCVRNGTIGATPGTYKASIQGVSTSATFGPDGTALGGGSPASLTGITPAGNNSVVCHDLANDIAVTRGQLIAGVWEPESDPPTNSSTFTVSINNLRTRNYYPVAVTKTNGAAWSKVSGLPVIFFRSASKSYGYPVETIGGDASLNTADTPDEYGTHFTLPAGSCSTFTVIGVECLLQTMGAAAKDVRFSLLSVDAISGGNHANSSSLAAITIDSDAWGAASDSDRSLKFYFDDSVTNLTCGNDYIVSMAPQTGTDNFGVYTFVMDADNDLTAYVGGTSMYSATRSNDSTTWTAATGTLGFCSPLIGDITEPSSGGGLKNLNSVSGGAQ